MNSSSFFFFTVLAIFVAIQLNAVWAAEPFAQGNLALIFDASSTGKSTENGSQMANLSSLWCQATSNGNDQLPIKSARFVHVHPLPLRHHQARLNPDGNRAFLDFGLVPTSVIGKYRCEITTEEDKLVTGNLFVTFTSMFNLLKVKGPGVWGEQLMFRQFTSMFNLFKVKGPGAVLEETIVECTA
uniref:Ig-like domain-containing protein n=1 Tax=Globodera pallida TaxID=36090 RepID=A0A183BLN8_GLOPA